MSIVFLCMFVYLFLCIVSSVEFCNVSSLSCIIFDGEEDRANRIFVLQILQQKRSGP